VKDVLLGERAREEPAPSRISQILSAWYLDPQFLDASGKPAVLPMAGDGPSMATLLRLHAGDSPHGAIIKELEELNLVERVPTGLRVLSREYIRSPTDPDMVRQACTAMHDHAATIAYNVNAKRRGPARFERMATHLSLPRRHQRDFENYLQTEGQEFLERIDHWLTERAAGRETHVEPSEGNLRIGVGMYLICGSQQGKQA
jgi:hypothetical protein